MRFSAWLCCKVCLWCYFFSSVHFSLLTTSSSKILNYRLPAQYTLIIITLAQIIHIFHGFKLAKSVSVVTCHFMIRASWSQGVLMTQRYGSTICHRVERIIVLYFGQEFLQASSMRASKVARFVFVSAS